MERAALLRGLYGIAVFYGSFSPVSGRQVFGQLRHKGIYILKAPVRKGRHEIIDRILRGGKIGCAQGIITSLCGQSISKSTHGIDGTDKGLHPRPALVPGKINAPPVLFGFYDKLFSQGESLVKIVLGDAPFGNFIILHGAFGKV